MGRSWAYILMAAATLAGAVALLWPSPEVPVIEQIAMPAKAARAEAPAKAAKPSQRPAAPAKAAKAEPEPATRMPPMNTTTRREQPQVKDNGLNPPTFLGGPSKAAPKQGPTGIWRMPGTPGANNGAPGAPPARREEPAAP